MFNLENLFRLYRETAMDDTGAGGDTGGDAVVDTGAANGGSTSDASSGVAADDAAATQANWRTEFSGGDKEYATRLERYKTQADMGKALKEAQNTIRSGNLLKPLAEGATPEEVTAYREQMGVPQEASGYLEALGEGEVIGENDKAIYDGLAGIMHKHNVKPEAFKDLHNWIGEMGQTIDDQQSESDYASADQLKTDLRQDWGSDYKPNLNVMRAFIDANMSEEAGNLLLSARGPDGGQLFNNREFIDNMVRLSREFNPIGAVLEPGSSSPGETIDAEIASIKGDMANNRDAYNKDAKKQERYRTLLEAKDRQEKATRRK